MTVRRSQWPDGTRCGAVFSEDMRHRYLLTRVMPDAPLFSGPRPLFPMFLMLNPSTATHEQSDPTITRCAGFAARWGYSSFHVCNLFSFRSTNPKVLKTTLDAEGDPANTATILASALESEVVVCAWGVIGELRRRADDVLSALRDAGFASKLRCLGTTKDGHPKHPLYLAAETELIPFVPDSDEFMTFAPEVKG
jgi:hypothetical protein